MRKAADTREVWCQEQRRMIPGPVGPKCAKLLGLPRMARSKRAADTARKPRERRVRITFSRPAAVDPRQMALPLEAA
jgi:hypothetical protein